VEPENRFPETRGPVGMMRCKECRGDTFSVCDLEDQSPIICDQCGGVVGRWADVRAMTNIPSKEIVEETGVDIFSESFQGVAEIALVEVEA
jgi:hypothetical protein